MTGFFSFAAADCNAHFFDDADIDRGHLCRTCRSRLVGFDELQPRNIGLGKLKVDWAYTYDNQLIVSSVARGFLSEHAVPAVFVGANTDPELWAVDFRNEFGFDTIARGTRFLDRCPSCGNFATIVGGYPACVIGVEGLSDTIYRSDMEFGSEEPKGPVIIAGPGMKTSLERHFQELDFEPVEKT